MLPHKIISVIVIAVILALVIVYFLVVPTQNEKDTTTYDIIEGEVSGYSKWGYADVDKTNGGVMFVLNSSKNLTINGSSYNGDICVYFREKDGWNVDNIPEELEYLKVEGVRFTPSGQEIRLNTKDQNWYVPHDGVIDTVPRIP
jgi:hypothetical protein